MPPCLSFPSKPCYIGCPCGIFDPHDAPVDRPTSTAARLSSVIKRLRHNAVAARSAFVSMLNDLNRIIASVADGIVVLDHDLRYTFVNDAAEQLFGLSRSAVIGRTPLELFADEVIEEAVPRMRTAIASGTVLRYERHYPIADRWYENRLYPSASGLTIFFTDITQRKKAEQALRQSEEAHRFLVSLETVRGGRL